MLYPRCSSMYSFAVDVNFPLFPIVILLLYFPLLHSRNYTAQYIIFRSENVISDITHSLIHQVRDYRLPISHVVVRHYLSLSPLEFGAAVSKILHGEASFNALTYMRKQNLSWRVVISITVPCLHLTFSSYLFHGGSNKSHLLQNFICQLESFTRKDASFLSICSFVCKCFRRCLCSFFIILSQSFNKS